MADRYIIDTNVLLSADASETPQHATHLSPACRQRSLDWLQAFLERRDRLVVDGDWQILGEYQKKSRPDDFATLFLREAFSVVDLIYIELDNGGEPLLPEALAEVVHDLADRKFVAVALACEDRPPIVNSADTDWLDWQEALASHEVVCQHLCPKELQERAAIKRAKKGRQ